MFAWMARWYQRRIINVNVNIIVAGILALGVTAGAMHHFVDYGLHFKLAKLIGLPDRANAVISVVTFLIDLIADLAVYYVLHWLANHMPRKAGRILDQLNPAYAHLSFVQDATLVQVERMALSPVFYVVALGGQYVLHVQMHMKVGVATVLSFGGAIIITRCMHTIWMLYRERQALHRLKTAAACGCGDQSGACDGSKAPATPSAEASANGTASGQGAGASQDEPRTHAGTRS